MAERQREKSAAAREIGPIPDPLYVEDRAKAADSLEYYCRFFKHRAFTLEFSPNHHKVITALERMIREGGQQAIAMPRGDGKTTICKCALEWAALFGYRRYLVWLSAEDDQATNALEGFNVTFTKNERVTAAFPETCWPLMALGSNNRRTPLLDGRELTMGIRQSQLILPDVPGSKSASCIIEAQGLLSAVRGLQYNRPDGEVVRPDAVVLDDPQTDASAKSLSMTEERERVINGAILGLAGPGVKLAAAMACTVIRPGDLSDRFLDRITHPEWQGIKTRILESMPKRMDWWDRYNVRRVESLRAEQGIKWATEFYIENRDKLDEGAAASWPERHNEDEASAIQHAMNLYFADKVSFFAERQNDPLRPSDEAEQLTRDGVLERAQTWPRGQVHEDTQIITSFCDIHKDAIYWMVCGFNDVFAGQILDYGTWPEQGDLYFTLRDISAGRRTLGKRFKRHSLQSAIQAGLTECFAAKLDIDWTTEGGSSMRLGLSAIDANWSQSTNAVDAFAATSAWKGRIYPSHGKGIGPAQIQISEWKVKDGDRRGHGWFVPVDRNGRKCRHIVYDTNLWKSHAVETLLAPIGGPFSTSLFAIEEQCDHRMLADHLIAETRQPTWGRGRAVDVWSLPPHKPDNHWFDCYVGCCMLASVSGVKIPSLKPEVAAGQKKKKKRRRVFTIGE